MYRVVITRRGEKDLDKFQGKLYDRIYLSLLSLSQNPFPPGFKFLTNSPIASYRIRVGDYRVLYDIDLKKKIVYVLKVGHRKDIYR